MGILGVETIAHMEPHVLQIPTAIAETAGAYSYCGLFAEALDHKVPCI